MNALRTRTNHHIDITTVATGRWSHRFRVTCWACGAVVVVDSEHRADEVARTHEACVAHVDSPLPTYRGPWVG